MAGRSKPLFLFWKWLLRSQWTGKNGETSHPRFKYSMLMYLANDQADRSVFGGRVHFGTAVAGVVLLTIVQKNQDPISELKGDPRHSICILM